MRIALPVLALSLALPLTAQVSGSINRDAPTVTNSIETKAGDKMVVSYTAIHFGEGKWMGATDNPEARERLNAGAAKRPVGSVHTTLALQAVGRTVPAGKYDMFFTLHESGTWVLNLKPQGDDEAEAIRWGLRLTETEHDHTRMYIALTPGAQANECSLTIAFGKMSVTVPVTPAPADTDK